jgi:hypothetical protein
MGWQQDYRVLYGKQVRIHPGKVKVYVSEVTRWRILRDGMREAIGSIPRSERRVYATMAELAAFFDYRMEGLLKDTEEKTSGLFDA